MVGRCIVISFLGAVITPALSWGQTEWGSTLTLGSGYATNGNASMLAESATYHTMGLEIGLRTASGLLLRYQGDGFVRSDVADHDATRHAALMTYGRSNDGGTTRWDVSLEGHRVWNQPAFEIYNRTNLTAGLGARWRPLVTGSIATHLTAGLQRHDHLEALDAVDLTGEIRANLSLPTRTSVTVTAGIEHRRYGDVTTFSTLETEGDDDPGGGPGNGPGNDMGEPGGPGSMRVARDGSPRWQETPLVMMDAGTADVATLHGVTVRVAQNLATGLGLSLQGSWRDGTSFNERYVDLGEQSLVSASQLLDDHLSYRSTGLRSAVHYRMTGVHRIDVSAHVEDRTYPGRPALDLLGEEIGEDRHDETMGAEVAYRLSPPRMRAAWRLVYRHRRNRSNDPLFDFRNDEIRLEATLRVL